ncbi:MAG: DUF3237 family protein [Proteobacteria bacterium]|nr:DUF3237 family protein [Pseudomonadota bacterium]
MGNRCRCPRDGRDTVATFETAEPALAWLTRSVVVGTGARHPAQVVIQFWTVT